jgi:type IV secretion system protein VirB10
MGIMRSAVGVLFVLSLGAQESAPTPETKSFMIEAGTRIPLTMLNSVSTKHAVEGDRVYLETLFPVLVNGKIVIPPGSSVAGTVTNLKRPGRVKGKGELYVRFDTLILPNGVVRDFKSRLGAIDGRDNQGFDREEGRIQGEGNKTGDAQTVGVGATTGATVGAIGGAVGGRTGMGLGVGAAAGAGAALMGVLLTRGPDVVLAKGSTVEMLLDRQLTFTEEELEFQNSSTGRRSADGAGPVSNKKTNTGGFGRRLPIP